ncbi:hypothetical protein B0F90DRAFT_1680625 [Multifurca ochricompacta]|uniref:WHIM1 domain-containing protein n=1 Tax=Multifurca ochricompacta TaxID=376703 RepID=A0AAD4QUC1_9AGAM|nr:hypothetical protein B0F90DRAFT_1680625 [Multifurca ochricompacta]
MKAPNYEPAFDKKGHICPPSNVTHPRDRWESLFVYSFISKFTLLRGKVEGLNSPMDFEEALLSHEPHAVMTQILTRFVLNLRPGTRNVSTDQISSTLSGVLADYSKTSERTVFWDDSLGTNVDPFKDVDGGFFAADWDTKLKVLRQLVELQLTHSAGIKGLIDRAWGVGHGKHKKKEPADIPVPDPSDPHSRESLSYIPVGQDGSRKRYWVVDDSPRVYLSSNPWKVTSTFQTVSSTRGEYLALVEKLKALAPAKPKLKVEFAHQNLVVVLEGRLEIIDKELTRIQRARKKAEQRNLLLAQAEIRQTRTRRQTRRPDYVYYDIENSDNEKDEEYKYQENDESADEDTDFMNLRPDTASAFTNYRHEATDVGRRRSTRTAVASSRAKRSTAETDPWTQWRGERRSTRLGAPPEAQLDEPPPKRARTEDTLSVKSGVSDIAIDSPVDPPVEKLLQVKHSGAAAIKPTEVAMEQIAGRKKSRFWYYAVEPIPEPSATVPVHGSRNTGSDFTSSESTAVPRLEGTHSHSPAPSIE